MQSIESQGERDETKNCKCKIYGVTLIRIKYDVHNLEEYIRHGLKNKHFI